MRNSYKLTLFSGTLKLQRGHLQACGSGTKQPMPSFRQRPRLGLGLCLSRTELLKDQGTQEVGLSQDYKDYSLGLFTLIIP